MHPLRAHLEHVEAHIRFPPQPQQKEAGDVRIAALFVPLHRLRRAAVRVRQARLDLAEHIGVPVPRDDVRLPVRGLVIGL